MTTTINHDLDSEAAISVFKKYPNAVIHMRQQYERHQFGLVFGAGIGIDLKFPRWTDLLKRIGAHPEINGNELISKFGASSAIAQYLYQHYKQAKTKISTTTPPKMLEMEVRAGWRKIVHSCLYEGVPENIDDLLVNDKYLQAFVPILKKTPLTVTYNFDDTLQRLLSKHRSAGEKGYRTCWSGNVQLHTRQGGVIYHPNGYLPMKLGGERPSDHLVFAEDSFADQLIDSMSGQYASLATHFSQTTCLLIGLSLDDPTLKHLLRQTANNFPGHFHYFVKFVREESPRDAELEQTQCNANFDVYNLNTLYINASEIKALAGLITLSDTEFKSFAERVAQPYSYRFFIVGSVAAGKSTTVGNFRSMLMQDEWTEERKVHMEKSPDLLDDEHKHDIDVWVAKQVDIKNQKLIANDFGIHIIDRCPLDAFAFTPERDQWRAKAKLLLRAILEDQPPKQLVPGHVIFLRGSSGVMAERAVSLHKVTNAEKLEKQQTDLLHVYNKLKPKGGFSIIDVDRKNVREIVKEVAHLIYRAPYEECNIHQLLLDINESGYDA